MSLYLGNQQIAGGALGVQGARNIGQLIFSLVPISDAGVHLADGTIINGTGIYLSFYNYMLSLYGDGTNVPAYFTDETSWQNSVTTYGVCGKFVIDTTNHVIRLPKITGIVEGTSNINALGDLVEAGLPNITGTATFAGIGSSSPGTGAFTSQTNGTAIAGSSVGTYNKPYFNASQSNSIYGNSTTVQPQTIKGYYYIVLAASVKTDVEIDVDQIEHDIEAKASLYSPAFTGTPTAPTAATSVSNTQIATTQYVYDVMDTKFQKDNSTMGIQYVTQSTEYQNPTIKITIGGTTYLVPAVTGSEHLKVTNVCHSNCHSNCRGGSH